MRADFLDLPERAAKPRSAGITHVLDRGLPLSHAAALLETGGEHIDVWKLGWGVSYLDPGLEAKLDLLSSHRVLGCPGGTLLEIAWAQGRTAGFFGWARACGFPCVEVSAGTAPMGAGAKRELIAEAARHFIVLAEVGPKDPAVRLGPDQWARDAVADLEAGATWVLLEGRASGAAGIYDASGAIRADVAEAVVAAAGSGSVVFEAPRESQQAWLVRRFGPDVNLANIAPAEALGLETLRLSLRADTYRALPQAAVPAGGT